jgi:glycerol-3-phosphate dehydrogenase (NAD(P)+)
MSSTDAEQKIAQVVEGKHNAAQISALASHHNIEMPISEAVNALLQGLISPKQAVTNLMSRPAREE